MKAPTATRILRFGSGWGAIRLGQWRLSGSGEGFRTNGYIDVPKDLRGTVDTPVNVQYGSGNVRLERLFGDRGRAFLTGSSTAKIGRTARRCRSTTPRFASWPSALITTAPPPACLRLRLYGGTQNYHQTFSSVAANRDSESLTDVQHVPVQQMGMIGQWSKQLARRFTMLAGLDGTYVQGVSLETTYSGGKPTANLSNGGTQEALGAFLEGIVQITHALVGDAGGPGRLVEQLRRQLHPHSGAWIADRHRLSRPRPERVQSRACRCPIESAITWCCTRRDIAPFARPR